MNLADYSRRSKSVSAGLARAALTLVLPYRLRRLTDPEWLALVVALAGLIQPAREESSRLAREFFDAERERQLPAEPRHDVLLESYYPPAWLAPEIAEYRDQLERPTDAEGEALTGVVGQEGSYDRRRSDRRHGRQGSRRRRTSDDARGDRDGSA